MSETHDVVSHSEGGIPKLHKLFVLTDLDLDPVVADHGTVYIAGKCHYH